MKFKKENYNRIIRLYLHQRWLKSKETQLFELISSYNRSESNELIYSLLERFSYLDNDDLNYLINEVADYIVRENSFDYERTQILSFTIDEMPDSSQKVLDMIKVPLYKRGWHSPVLVNTFYAFKKYFDKGRNQIIMIDEFIGSGKTIRNRMRKIHEEVNGNYDIKFCFIAGIKHFIDELTTEGFDIFCPLQLDRGISDYYKDDSLKLMTEEMLLMESHLAPNINKKKLSDYTFGYGGAEALYSLEGCNGNTPNSVFPIFWWIKDRDNKERNTILTRFEIGF